MCYMYINKLTLNFRKKPLRAKPSLSIYPSISPRSRTNRNHYITNI